MATTLSEGQRGSDAKLNQLREDLNNKLRSHNQKKGNIKKSLVRPLKTLKRIMATKPLPSQPKNLEI